MSKQMKAQKLQEKIAVKIKITGKNSRKNKNCRWLPFIRSSTIDKNSQYSNKCYKTNIGITEMKYQITMMQTIVNKRDD